MEQLPLDLEGGNEGELVALSIPEFEALYREKVGISPRGWDKETLVYAIQNPEEERARIAGIDAQEDREDLRATYRR